MSETLREGVELLAWTLDEAADEVAEVGAETGAVVTIQVELRRSLARDLRALLAATAPTPDDVGLVEVDGFNCLGCKFCAGDAR